jgi:hypothetical protein
MRVSRLTWILCGFVLKTIVTTETRRHKELHWLKAMLNNNCIVKAESTHMLKLKFLGQGKPITTNLNQFTSTLV